MQIAGVPHMTCIVCNIILLSTPPHPSTDLSHGQHGCTITDDIFNSSLVKEFRVVSFIIPLKSLENRWWELIVYLNDGLMPNNREAVIKTPDNNQVQQEMKQFDWVASGSINMSS